MSNAGAGPVSALDRAAAVLRRPRVGWGVLVGAMVAAAVVIGWSGRDTTLFDDELFVFSNSRWDLDYLLSPHNEHLVLPVRVTYQAVFAVVGPEYAVLRGIGVAALLGCVGLFFVLAKRRVDPLLALLASVLLLFLGLGWQGILLPFVAISACTSIGAGVGALLALERDDRAGDALACLLATLAVATFTVGLAFLVGVAVWVLLRRDRWRRAWVFLVPLVLYAAWWAWARKFDQESAVHASNIPMVPEYFVDSLAWVLGALAGLNELVGLEGLRAFDATGPERLLGIAALVLRWALVVLAVVALGLRIRRGRVPSSLWVSLAVLTTYWLAGALAQSAPQRVAESSRYVFPGAIGVLLVATDVLRERSLGRRMPAVALAVFAFALAANLHELRDASALFREQSRLAGAQLAALELAQRTVDPGYLPSQDPALFGYTPVGFPVVAGDYLRATQRYGSAAFSLDELRAQDEQTRRAADATLARALDLHVSPAGPQASREGCRRQRGEFELPRGGALLRSNMDAPVMLARFATTPFFGIGSAPAGQFVAVAVPADPAPDPWRAAVGLEAGVTICPLGAA